MQMSFSLPCNSMLEKITSLHYTVLYSILNCFHVQMVDALSLAQATMAKVHQNLAWAVAYNIVAIPIAAGVLLPQFDFAMTPSLSGKYTQPLIKNSLHQSSY